MSAKLEKSKILIAKILATIAAFSVLTILFLVPVFLFRVYSGISLDAKGPEGEIWFLVIGGGIGAGAAFLTFRYILRSMGSFSETELDELWYGKKDKNK